MGSGVSRDGVARPASVAATAQRGDETLDDDEGVRCPITQEVMHDPVIAGDGHSYERRDVEAWFARGKRTSPKTGARLPHTHLTPNHNLKSAIRDFLEEVRSFDAATAGARD